VRVTVAHLMMIESFINHQPSATEPPFEVHARPPTPCGSPVPHAIKLRDLKGGSMGICVLSHSLYVWGPS
jgi:hypothetical protein